LSGVFFDPARKTGGDITDSPDVDTGNIGTAKRRIDGFVYGLCHDVREDWRNGVSNLRKLARYRAGRDTGRRVRKFPAKRCDGKPVVNVGCEKSASEHAGVIAPHAVVAWLEFQACVFDQRPSQRILSDVQRCTVQFRQRLRDSHHVVESEVFKPTLIPAPPHAEVSFTAVS
jgi:hypothetical protein